MNARDVLIGAGFATAAIGIAAIVSPGVVGVSVEFVAVLVLGGLMVLRAVTNVLGAEAALDQATTGDPERLTSMPRPGDRADLRIARLDRVSRVGGREAIRDRVLRAGARAIARTEGVTETEARDRIESKMTATRREYEVIADLDGTDDPPSPSRDSGGRIGAFVRRWRANESTLQRRARRAIDAIGRRLDMPPVDLGDGYPDALDRMEERLDTPTRGGRSVGPESDEEWTRIDDDTHRRDRRETGHWVGMVALALAFAGAGVITSRPPLLLAAAVGIGFAAYRNSADGATARVAIDRSIDPEEPGDDEPATVTLTIENETGRALPDLRIVDGVPERLEVVSGVPRLGTALGAGDEATLEYDVLATRGTHEFGAVTVLSRDWSGAVEDELTVDVETRLSVVPSLVETEPSAPLRNLAVGYVGRAATERGSGVEFDSVREYRHGDPLKRVDWNRYARTGELATLRFREGRATTVYVLVDARAEAYVAPDDGEHAVDRGVDAAGRLFATLTAASTPVGIGALGADWAWLDAGVGEHHRHRAEQLLGTDPAFDPLPSAKGLQAFRQLQAIKGRLPADAQILFITPLCDGVAPFVARRLDDYGHPVTVLSPDPTGGDSIGGRLVRIERHLWALDLMGSGVPVLDWEWDQPLEVALRRAATGDQA